jgi:hypothetical protein
MFVPSDVGHTGKVAVTEVIFVAMGPVTELNTIVYGARPFAGVTIRFTQLPRQMFVLEGTMLQTGFGLTTTVSEQEPVQPLASVMVAV